MSVPSGSSAIGRNAWGNSKPKSAGGQRAVIEVPGQRVAEALGLLALSVFLLSKRLEFQRPTEIGMFRHHGTPFRHTAWRMVDTRAVIGDVDLAVGRRRSESARLRAGAKRQRRCFLALPPIAVR